MNAFSCNLRRLIAEKRISSCKLAKSVGVHVSTVTNWLNGSNPRLEHLRSLSLFFDVPVGDLLKEDDKK